MPKAKTRESQSVQDYRKLSLTELTKRIIQRELQLQELRAQLAIGKLTNHRSIAKARKDIAHIKTVRQEKILLEEIGHGR